MTTKRHDKDCCCLGCVRDRYATRVKAAYWAVPQYIREDIVEAAKWARKTLTEYEGAGHEIFVTSAHNRMVVCSFAKPEWAGDHCGAPMEHGAQAIVRAVCEYLNGA